MNKIIFLSLVTIINSQNFNNQNWYNNKVEKVFADNWDDLTKMTYYQTEKISPELAFIYQYAIPLPFLNLGYAYSDNWNKGLMKDVLSLGGLILGNIIIERTYDDGYYYDEDGYYIYGGDESSSPIGALLIFGSIAIQLYKIYDVYNLAEQYNDELYKSLFYNKRPKFSINLKKDDKQIELAVNFPIN